MNITSNGQEYHISWVYYPNDKFPLIGSVCRIQTVDEDKVIGRVIIYGNSYTSEKDVFNKNIGRKHSFARAVQKFPKEERLIFWKEYFNLQHKDYLKEI